MEHSRLLKFLVPGRSHSTEMAETSSFKVQYEYQNPENVESEVPGSQNIRKITDKPHDESTDGAEIQNGGYTITRSYTEQSETVEGTTITRTTVTLSTNSTSGELVKEEKTEVSSERMEAEDSRPKTKIPKLKFRQAAERVKRERRLTRGLTEHETHIPVPSTPTNKLSRHSKIPPPTSKPVVHKRDGEEESFRPDEEFDKIYEEIVENTQTEIEVKHPEIIESKFEEIIHDYDENKIQPINVEKLRQSRIPSLRRRTSEQADTKTVLISEKTKSRSLPRLKEISMRVKEDEGLGPVKYSRTVSTENTRGGGQKSVVETRIVKNPDVETKISKIVTTERITGGKELNKNLESSSKTVTVHRTVQVTSQGDASINIDKNIGQSNTVHTENIMKGSICIGYPTFEANITENTSEMSNEPTKPHESVENINTESKIVGSEEKKMVLQQSQSNVSETTSNMESNIITKVTTTKLASSFERTTGAKEIVSSKIYSNENNNLVEITEVNPTIERSMTVTRVISSNSNDGQIKEKDISKTPTTNKDIHRSITTERNTVEVRSKIPTIERSTTVTRVISSSNDVKVKDVKSEKSSDIKTITTETNLVAIDGNASEINSNVVSETKVVDDPKTPTKDNDDIIKKITTVQKVVDIQNTSPTIDRSMTVTLITETNNQKDIEDLKSPTDDKDDNIDKTFAKKTIISAISKQMNENRENVEKIVSNKKDERIESHAIMKEKNVVDITIEKSKVGKLIHRIDSREQTTETMNKHKADEMPKKKSILSKIAMFERHDIEDQMPKKKPDNLSKLVIKHPPQKVAHLHTPTIVEEVLKTRENSPLTATSNINIDPLRSEKVTTHDFNINAEIRQVGHGIDSVQGYKDQSFYKSKSFKEYDYKVNADEYKQTVEMTKITSNLTIQDNKENNVATTDYVIQEVQNTENKTEQNVVTSKETVLAASNNNISLVKPDLVATLEYKFESNIDDQSNQYEEEIMSNERKSETIANNDKEYNSGTSELTQASDYKFRGVNRLTSEFERRVEVSNNKKVTAKDYKIDQRPALIATMDYRFDGDVSTQEFNKKIETSEQIAETTSNEKQIPNTPEHITTFDYKSKVDIKVQDTEYEQKVDKGEENSDIISERNKEKNVGTSETPAIEYTFKDVKKLATEYEQKVEFTKNLEVQPRTDTLSPGLLNYESKIFSRSTESLGKVMTDAPVIFITPKTDLQTNTNISKIDDKIEISTTQMKEAVEHKIVENTAIQLEKQISTEYKEAKIYDNKFIERENAHAHIIERSTSLTRQDADSNIFKRSTSLTTATAENRNVTSTTTINTSRFTRSSSNISVGHKEFKEERNVGNFTTTKQSNNTQILDKPIDGSSEIKTVKAKGYVIRREGDLAYARIQEEAEQGDEIRMFDQNPKLPRTPIKETSSTVTNRRFKSVEEKKKYYADVDINTVIKGKVSRMISRMTSLEPQEVDKKNIDIKEMPRKMSVLEKIAMFEVSESKAAASKTEYSFVSRTKIEKTKPQAVNMTQEEFEERVAELKSARLMYGRIENMPNILLRNGVEMPVLALGTAMLDPRLIHHVIGAAIDLGYRAIDTAYIYGNEKEIGEAIRAKIEDGTVRRDELFVISKLWSTFHRTDLVEKACRSSLESMGLEYFDLYLIHNPMSFKEGGDAIPKIATVVQYSQFDYLDAWYGMEQLMTKGLVRSIGVSNFNSAQLQRILDKGKIKPTVNQVECHPYLSQQKLDVFCEERDIKLSCFGVLGSKGTPAEYKSTLPPVIDDPLVQLMASGLNVSPAQLLIRYQLDSGRNAVVKSSSAKRLWDNLQALTFTLSQGQVEALHALNRNKRTFTFQGMGDTHKNYPFKIAF